MNLIEKLENYRDAQTDFEATLADAVIDSCIDIVKQHQAESDWVSVDERLPPHNNNEANTPKILGDSKTYGVISVTYDAPRNLWFTYGGDDQVFDITSWMFAPKPPSEVQA